MIELIFIGVDGSNETCLGDLFPLVIGNVEFVNKLIGVGAFYLAKQPN